MGLFEFADDNFSLVVRDTAAPGGPDGAARDALADGAKLILGPLFAADVKRAAGPVQGAHVPLVSFSNDTSAAGNGLYVLGVTPQSQVDRVVSYAASQNLKRFAILVPNSPYGKSVLSAYQESVVKAGGTVAQMQFYDPAAPDPTASVKTLAGAYQNGGFDALMIPEGGQKLRIMASMLPAYEIPTGTVRLLGTNLWSDPSLANEPAMAGGWFAAPPPDRWQAFAQKYQQAYGAPPDVRAGVVYDAVTLAVALAKSAPGGDFSQTRLTDPSGFNGVTGVFRFNADGTAERGLAVIEIDPGALNVKDPAPSTFAAMLN
jgi:ABC-type branched-subunit amino acid transport system substrate-binding protein